MVRLFKCSCCKELWEGTVSFPFVKDGPVYPRRWMDYSSLGRCADGRPCANSSRQSSGTHRDLPPFLCPLIKMLKSVWLNIRTYLKTLSFGLPPPSSCSPSFSTSSFFYSSWMPLDRFGPGTCLTVGQTQVANVPHCTRKRAWAVQGERRKCFYIYFTRSATATFWSDSGSAAAAV